MAYCNITIVRGLKHLTHLQAVPTALQFEHACLPMASHRTFLRWHVLQARNCRRRRMGVAGVESAPPLGSELIVSCVIT